MVLEWRMHSLGYQADGIFGMPIQLVGQFSERSDPRVFTAGRTYLQTDTAALMLVAQ